MGKSGQLNNNGGGMGNNIEIPMDIYKMYNKLQHWQEFGWKNLVRFFITPVSFDQTVGRFDYVSAK